MTALSFFVSDMLIDKSAELGKEQLLTAQHSRIKDIVHSTAVGLESLTTDLDISEQLKIISEYVEKARFEDDASGYFFVYKGTIAAAHPIQKQLLDKDLSSTTDVNGVYYVKELERAANAGGGFVNFTFPKPGAGDVQKLGYAEIIQGTPFWIGTGVYTDNVEKTERVLLSSLEELLRKSKLWIGGLILFLLVIGIPISVLLIKSIIKPLTSVTSKANLIAGGQLDVDINPIGKDEVTTLETALVTMIASLREAIRDAEEKKYNADQIAQEAQKAREQAELSSRDAAIKNRALLTVANKLTQVSAAVSSSSNRLSSQIAQSSSSASEAAKRLSEAATAMNEMNVTVQEVARNASVASSSSTETKAKAEAGANIVEDSLYRIESVHHVSLELKENMNNLSEHAQNITKIMGVISDIADQTNLLALNAAIEAARAGEAGRGFAVVADEVRKLAEKTMASTNDVSSAIKAIQESTTKSAAFVENAVMQIEEATQFAQESGKALKEIVTTAETTADQVNSIAAASEEQSASSEEINNSILQCNDMSSQISEAMNEATKAVSDLTNEMHELLVLIHELKDA